MDWIILFGGAVLLLVGFAGCIFPVIPGPPIAYGSLLLLLLHSTASDYISTATFIWLGVGVVFVTLMDFILPVWGTKKYGGTRAGRTGSTLGLIVGLFFGPVAIVVAPFIGAFVGELVAGQTRNVAFRSAFGSFLGFLAGTFLKIIVVGFIAYTFLKAII